MGKKPLAQLLDESERVIMNAAEVFSQDHIETTGDPERAIIDAAKAILQREIDPKGKIVTKRYFSIACNVIVERQSEQLAVVWCEEFPAVSTVHINTEYYDNGEIAGYRINGRLFRWEGDATSEAVEIIKADLKATLISANRL